MGSIREGAVSTRGSRRELWGAVGTRESSREQREQQGYSPAVPN